MVEINIQDVAIEIQELFAFISSFITDNEVVSKVQNLLKIEKSDDYKVLIKHLEDLYEVLELIAFTISEKEGLSTQIIESPYMKNVKLSQLFNKLDLLSHQLYRQAKSNPELQTSKEKQIRLAKEPSQIYEPFELETDVFGQLNPEFLLPTEEYFTKTELPKDATIINIHVDNTQNLIVSTRKVLDRKYVDEHYPFMNIDNGVTEDVLDRFKVLSEYPPSIGETTTVPLGTKEVYQNLGNVYRKLIHYPPNDYVRNYDFLPINALITNFENKRITMLRQNIPKSRLYTPLKSETIGKIKNNFINKRKSMSQSVFDALYEDSMTDEQVAKLAISSFTLQGQLPDNIDSVKKDFDKLVNRRSIKKLL